MRTLFFFDDRAIQNRDNMIRRLGKPNWVHEATLEDDITEGAWNYPTVWHDTKKDQWCALYGGAAPHSFASSVGFFLRTQILLYARSGDGVHWEKPDLTHETPSIGRLRPNQVFCSDIPINSRGKGGPRIDGGPVYYDQQEPENDRRLKYLYRYIDDSGRSEERLVISPDGIKWKWEELPWGREFQFHSPVAIFFNRHSNSYFISNRFSLHDRRIVFRETKDFKSINKPELILQSDPEDPPLSETYAMLVFPYEGMYIGLLWILHTNPAEITLNRLYGFIDCSLTYSYYGKVFNRAFHEAFIPRNIKGEHGGGCIFPSSMVCCSKDIRIYSGGSKAEMFRNQGLSDAGLLLHTLRKDGFVYLESNAIAGRIITKGVVFKEDDLRLNICAPYGRVRIQILELSGKPIDGLTFMDSVPFTGDEIDYRPCWKNGKGIKQLIGKPVFLEIEIAEGSIYAIRGELDLVGPGLEIYD